MKNLNTIFDIKAKTRDFHNHYSIKFSFLYFFILSLINKKKNKDKDKVLVFCDYIKITGKLIKKNLKILLNKLHVIFKIYYCDKDTIDLQGTVDQFNNNNIFSILIMSYKI